MTSLSVQLYTLRELLAEDLPGTLDRLAGLGFAHVEPFRLTDYAAQLGPALAASGLTAPTAHQHVVGTGHEDEIFGTAATLGVGTVFDPRIDRQRFESADGVAAVAEDLNAAAAVAEKHGVRIGYHNHAQELEIVHDGTTALDLLASHLDDAVVLEVDTYWAAVGGQDPVALLKRLGDRVTAVHVKDGPATADPIDQVPVGQGDLPVREILAAAPHALRVVELDDTRGDRFQAVADSITWLRAEGLA
ncbi:sugar phosphate isomerase/epimerase [Pseudonocardia sp. DSM 110487]|uniref:sugar phosphate isomerase/epimerase family protein n=1 Tax=Pseudonocardia sp. DSM 110487 TaxID=2865833 RepID=UPI001C6A6D34|nr:sugar phosphate isomerase/epimerase [Pseudonocardia sp. DSM 110487]QYN39694.1 sugar phosphate isomerase/epimerase [Pseudonocardia sp. DSM 110487]